MILEFLYVAYLEHNLQDLQWLKSFTNLPILIKGVLTREDGKSIVFPYFFAMLYILHFYMVWFNDYL